MPKIIFHHILKEILPNFLAACLVLTFVLTLAKVLELTDLVVVKGVSLTTMAKFLLFSIPSFLAITIPLSTLLAVLLTFLRMSGDQEITALKSAGVSLYRLLPPVLFFCFGMYLLTSYMTLSLVPSSNRAFRNELLALARISADISIKAGVFNNEFKQMVIYVNHIDLGESWMRDIFIEDARDEDMVNAIVASRGRIATDTRQRDLVFELYDGVVDRMGETIDFERYDLKLDMESSLAKESSKKPDQFEMNTGELWANVKTLEEARQTSYYKYLLEAHKRFALPVTCLILGIVGLILGVQGSGRGRNWGVTIGLIVFIVYYVLFTIGLTFGERGGYPPALAMWLPNVIMGAAGIYLFHRANNEAPSGLLNIISGMDEWLRKIRRTGQP